MRRIVLLIALLAFVAGCSRKQHTETGPAATAHGTAIIATSGDKQVAAIGNMLDQPLIVQVNDPQGNGVTGAPVWFSGPHGVTFDPSSGVTDSSGQVATAVTLGGMAGRYQLTAYTRDGNGKRIDLTIPEIALGYQETLGKQLNDQYCGRCHNPESTAERVSNFDNLTTKPHAFTEGDALNSMSDQDLMAIISHGGSALNKSAEMPPFGYTLKKSDIEALVAYIRAVADPPHKPTGLVYAQNR